MHSWTVSKWGVENLRLISSDIPQAADGEVLVRFEAASLNYRDLLIVQGLYNPKFPRPLIPGSDAYGTVVEVGEGVDERWKGRKVLSLFAPGWRSGPPQVDSLRQTLGGPLDGVFQEYRLFRPEQLQVLEEPSALTPQEWATLPCAGVTAWSGLVGHGLLKPGQTVLLIGTGGVSLFGLQIAKMLGARALLLSSSASKRERAKEMGASACADYKENPEWGRWVLEQTDGQGADLILETGGSGTLAQSLKAVKVGGRISLIGVLSGSSRELNILPLLMKAVCIQGVVVGNQQDLKQLIAAYLQTMLRPVLDQVFAFEELPQAFAALASGEHFGKIGISFAAAEDGLKDPAPL